MEHRWFWAAATVAADYLDVHPMIACIAADRVEERYGHLQLTQDALLELVIMEVESMGAVRGMMKARRA